MVSLILLPQDRGEWSVSRFGRFTSVKKNSRYPLKRGLVGP